MHYINVCTQTWLALFHPPSCVSGDEIQSCRKGGLPRRKAYSVTLLLASKAICPLLPSSYAQPRFPNAVLWRSRTRHAGVCSVYSTTNAFSRFHVDSEIADTLVKRRFPRDASPLLRTLFFVGSDMSQRCYCSGKQRRRSGQCCGIYKKLIRK